MVGTTTLRARLGTALGAAFLLLAPASAMADITSQISTASPGAVIELPAGTYTENVNVNKAVTLRGVGVTTKILGAVTMSASGAKLENLAVEAPSAAASAINFTAAGTAAGVVAQRSAGSGPVIDVDAAATLERSYIVQGSATAAEAVLSAGGLKLLGSMVLSVKGPAARLTGATTNLFQGAVLATTDPAANGVELLSDNGSTTAKRLVVESSVLDGGDNGAGLLAETRASVPPATGSLEVLVRHSTLLGKNGIAANAKGAPLLGNGGNVNVHVGSSIVSGEPVKVSTTAPITGATANATVDLTNSFTGDPSTVLRPGSYALRADAGAVIDKGGALADGQYDKDYAGEPRAVGTPDIGADEFVNQAPTAVFGVTNAKPKRNEVIGFISGSRDAEDGAGGGIVEYRWNFGDGTAVAGPSGAVPHAYKATGTYRVTLTTVDRHGAVTTSDAIVVTVVDGDAPKLAVALPESKQVLRLNPRPRKGVRRRPAPIPLEAAGTAADESVTRVVVALTLTRRDAVKGRRATAGCAQFTGKAFAKAACDKLVWHEVSLVGTGWTFSTPKGVRVPSGRYQLRVRAMDAAGNITAAPNASDRTLVAFRVK